jgi:hypothetical protein
VDHRNRLSHALGDCPSTQTEEKYVYPKVHAFKVLSSALSEDVKDMMEE